MDILAARICSGGQFTQEILGSTISIHSP